VNTDSVILAMVGPTRWELCSAGH